MKRFSVISTCVFLLIISTSFQKKKFSDTFYIVIDKSDYELTVIDSLGWLATYPVVFGKNYPADKMLEGDQKTPEGIFTLIGKIKNTQLDKELMLDYPTKADSLKFTERKRQGLIPANALLGDAIRIHGVPAHKDYLVDKYANWTDGGISMKNEDVEELYRTVPVGTKVYIRK